MARQLRVEYEGAIYHVTCRMLGDARSRLFRDDADRERFLERLSERVERYNIRLYLFVLMTNHFHLVFETPEGNCSKFMQSLSTAYTVYYNLRHRRHGHLFDGRYKAKLVEGDDHLLSLTRYVHLNPVQVGSLKRSPLKERMNFLRQYSWSTYQSYIGKRKKLPFVEYAPALAQMGGGTKERPKRYREFVESGLSETDDEFEKVLKASPRSIGSDGFRVWVDELHQRLIEKSNAPEDISFRRITEPLDPEEVLEVVAEKLRVDVEEFRVRRRNSPLRAVAARFLIKYAGLSQREIADFLNAGSGAAISKAMQRYKGLMTGDRELVKVLESANEILDQHRNGVRK